MKSALPLLSAALTALTAPGLGACSREQCLSPPDWPDKLDFGPRLPDRGVEFQRFSVDSSGTILWRGFPSRPAPVSLAELREIVAAAGESPMEPWLVLDAPADADCATVRAVRAELDKLHSAGAAAASTEKSGTEAIRPGGCDPVRATFSRASRPSRPSRVQKGPERRPGLLREGIPVVP